MGTLSMSVALIKFVTPSSVEIPRIMNTLLKLSLVLYFVGAVQPRILISQASVYDAVIQGAEVRGYLLESVYSSDPDSGSGSFPEYYELLLSQLEDSAAALSANAVVEFSYTFHTGPTGSLRFLGTGVAVCDQRLANPFC